MDPIDNIQPVEPAPPVLGYAHGDYRQKPPPMTFGQKIAWLAGIASGMWLLTSFGSIGLQMLPLFRSAVCGLRSAVVAAFLDVSALDVAAHPPPPTADC